MLRIERVLSNRGYCTRGQTDDFLRDFAVTHKGVRLTRSGVQVDPDQLLIDDQPLDPEVMYVLFNKPAGYICSHGDAGPVQVPLVYELLPDRWTQRKPVVTTVGRLDKDTTGLLLLSDDGTWVHKLTSPKHHVPRLYRATVEKPLDELLVKQFASGQMLLKDDDRPLLPAELVMESANQCTVTLHEGRYHQVRRMFASVGNHVTQLHRFQFGNLSLTDLPEGQFRFIRPNDVA
jgi:16S rRNA pseudouridine516 synthase